MATLRVCVEIPVVKKRILVLSIYMAVTNVVPPSLPFHATFAHSLLGITDTLAQASEPANLEPWIS